MTRYAWTAMLVLFGATAGLATYASESASVDEQAISKIEKEWNEAIKNKSKAFFDKYISDDFTYISDTGEFSSGRAAYIDATMRLPEITEYTVTEEKIRVHGSTAVATARWSGKIGDQISDIRYTDVYAKGPDGWKAIALQETNAK